MIARIPRISVKIITYNQEKLIKRAIDSVLEQKDYVYEICISDDCSQDKTWDIILEYAKEYPGLFTLNRNKENLGVFQNVEQSWKLPSGDLVYNLAGDDEIGEGWLEKVINYIISNRIDYTSYPVCIYGNYQAIYPNGDRFTLRNDLVTQYPDATSLSLRQLICSRSTCYSISILKSFIPVSNGRSFAVEAAQDRQLQLLSKYNYYIPAIGNKYYTRIGIGQKMNTPSILVERESIMLCLLDIMRQLDYSPTHKDLLYMDFFTLRCKTWRDHRISHYFNILVYFIKSRDFSYGFRGWGIKRFLFAIARRLPHRKSLNWTI